MGRERGARALEERLSKALEGSGAGTGEKKPSGPAAGAPKKEEDQPKDEDV